MCLCRGKARKLRDRWHCSEQRSQRITGANAVPFMMNGLVVSTSVVALWGQYDGKGQGGS